MSSKLILWIENELEYAGSHLKVLRRAGYTVHTAWSAEEGVRRLRQQGQKCDLILLDILMGERPVEGREVINGRTGLALYEVIRDDLNLTIPIVFVTVIVNTAVVADIQQRESMRGFSYHILHKPARPSELLEAVQAIIGPAESKESKSE
jgi:CheY-like chemotaxis protein